MHPLNNNPKVPILGIPLYAADIPRATEVVINGCSEATRNNHCISATGAHGLVHAKRNQSFAETLKSFFLNLPDGMPGVWVGRMKGAKEMRRCYGPDFFEAVLRQSAHCKVRHFFCGGNVGVANELHTVVEKRFRNQNVVGTLCPPFLDVEKYDYKAIAEQIETTHADIVWIGLSTPKQEIFARKLSQFTNVHFIITVGAAFDFYTGRVTQAPVLLQKMGLEWLFRLTMEPRRLFKRYLEIVPLFILYNLGELFGPGTRK